MAAIEDLKRAGATIVDPARVDLDDVRRPQGAGPCGGFKYDINRYLAAQGDRVPVHSLEEIIRSRRFPSLDRARACSQAQDGPENGPDTPACKAEADYREQFRAAVAKTMDAHKLDAFVYPTWSNPPRLIGDLNTPHGDNSQVFSPTTGWPAINVPMGYTRGTLPDRHDVLRPRVERADADQARLRLRAGDTTPPSAGVGASAQVIQPAGTGPIGRRKVQLMLFWAKRAIGEKPGILPQIWLDAVWAFAD